MIGCATSTAPPAGALARRAAATTCAALGRREELVPPPLAAEFADFAFIHSILNRGRASSWRRRADPRPDDTRAERTSPADGFWADEHALALGHDARHTAAEAVLPAAFARFVEEGFQFTSTRHQGVYADASWSSR